MQLTKIIPNEIETSLPHLVHVMSPKSQMQSPHNIQNIIKSMKQVFFQIAFF